MNEEITESAKAVQEIAKTAREAIGVTEKLGKFVSALIHEPTKTVVAILTDRLKYMRWERQIRLLERMKQMINDRHLSVDILSVPPKIALPIIENATLEEDDIIQDMWASLFIASGNKESKRPVRVAYIDIIRQLERIDAEILKSAYLASFKAMEKHREFAIKHNFTGHPKPTDLRITAHEVCGPIGLKHHEHEDSFDNLFRLRCLRSYVDEDDVSIPEERQAGQKPITYSYTFSHDEQYGAVCITPFGYDFVEICMGKKPAQAQ